MGSAAQQTVGRQVAVVIPVRNAAADILGAVDAALAQPEVGSVIVAVGPSDDGSNLVVADLAAADARVVHVDNPGGTIPAGLNRAIAAVDDAVEVIVRCDAHARLPEGYVAEALGWLDADERIGNVGGIQQSVGETGTERAVGAALMSRFGAGGAAFHQTGGAARSVDTVYLGVFRKAALHEVGGFDETLLTNEDYELNWRLREAGWTVWLDPAMRVDYRPRGSLDALARQFWRYGWWKQRMLRRHPESVRPRQMAAPLLVLGLVGSAILAVLPSPLTRMLARLVPALYGGALAAGVVSNGATLEPAERARLVAVYPTMHLSWGAGFIASAIDGSLRGRAAPRHTTPQGRTPQASASQDAASPANASPANASPGGGA